MALECSLALSALWLSQGLRRGTERTGTRLLGLALIVALAGLAAAMTGLRAMFGPALFSALMAAMALLAIGWTAQCLLLPWLRRLRAHALAGLLIVVSPALYMVLLLLFLMRRGLEQLGQVFAARQAVQAIPADWLSLVMGLNLLTGALLLAAAVSGLTCSGRMETAGRVGAMAWNFRLFLGLAILRLGASFFSLMTCAEFFPLGALFFYHSLLNQDVPMFVLRLLLGLILPALYALLGLAALREDGLSLEPWIFLPLLLMVLSGELIAWSLTAGLWGIAF